MGTTSVLVLMKKSKKHFPEVNGNGSFTTNDTSTITIRVGNRNYLRKWGPDVPVELEARVGNDTYPIFYGTSADVAGTDPVVISNVPSGTTAHFKGTSYHPIKQIENSIAKQLKADQH